MSVCLCNPYLGVLMDHADNHLIKNFFTGSDHLGVQVRGGANGVLETLEHHPHFWGALMPEAWNMPSFAASGERLAAVATVLELAGCRNEDLRLAGYSNLRNGFILRGLGPKKPCSVRMRVVTADTTRRDGDAFRIGPDVQSAEIVGGQAITGEYDAWAVTVQKGFAGRATFHACIFRNMLVRQQGSGELVVQSSNIFWRPSKLLLESGSLRLENCISSFDTVKVAKEGRLSSLGNFDQTGELLGPAGGNSPSLHNVDAR